ncbi:stage III sporulation protein AG [Bacillus songklensis]|uniref:Stage III sporulation protein AG n=1 Tax=Bacillus songklensis TaxID=1069116 RepID=A0ABV8AY48_9BACI
MRKDDGIFSSIRRLFSSSQQPVSEKKNPKLLYVILLLGVGAAFMLISNTLSSPNSMTEKVSSIVPVSGEKDTPVFGQKESAHSKAMVDYEDRYENQLREALQSIAGVDDVEVVVNLDATESRVYEKDKVTQNQSTDETDREGGKRKGEDSSTDEKLVIIRNGDQEKPVIIKTEKPKIRGVLIVAKGADNIQVKKWIVEAVTRVLDVPSHRVAVLPKKSKGE